MSSRFVVPGEQLASEEELNVESGAYERGGDYYASRAGVFEVDSGKREGKLSDGPKRLERVGPGAIVFGVVRMVMQNVAVIDLWAEPKGNSRPYLTSTSGVVPIAMATNDYLEDLRDAFRVGDFVKAKVVAVEVGGGYKMSTKDSDLGVILAKCSKCRSDVKLSGNKLVCTECKNFEKRTFSAKDYILKE